MTIKERFKLPEKSKIFIRILKNFNLKNKKVLDIGCGYGEHLVQFGKDSIGVTVTLSEGNYGKKKGLNIRYGNVESMDFSEFDKDFDIIWANNFFEHILSPHSFLIKLKEISDKDALLILGVPTIPRIHFF